MKLLKTAFTTKLWVTVLVGIIVGGAVGLVWPEAGKGLAPVGTTFIAMIRMLIAPIVFCTIVSGIASAQKLTGVGRIGVKALVFFEIMTTLALVVGLVVMNVFKPGQHLHADPTKLTLSGSGATYAANGAATHWYDFLINIVPDGVVNAFTDGNVLQVLFVAVLFAVALRALGERAVPIVKAIDSLSEIFFGMVRIVMYLSPIGAFGAMAYATGAFGWSTLRSLASFVVIFWVTGILFCLIGFGIVARVIGLRILPIMRYFREEYLITLGTANYEAVMPQLLRKLQRLGAPRDTVGIVVPAGYAFNGDGVCLYLGFAALFLAQAFGIDLSLGQQIGLLAVFLITSKGSAGVAGAGFVILAATLSATGTVPIVGIMLILGIDRFLSVMRGLVSLTGQMVGSLVVARWENELDVEHTRAELRAGPSSAAEEDLRSRERTDLVTQASAPKEPSLTRQ